LEIQDVILPPYDQEISFMRAAWARN